MSSPQFLCSLFLCFCCLFMLTYLTCFFCSYFGGHFFFGLHRVPYSSSPVFFAQPMQCLFFPTCISSSLWFVLLWCSVEQVLLCFAALCSIFCFFPKSSVEHPYRFSVNFSLFQIFNLYLLLLLSPVPHISILDKYGEEPLLCMCTQRCEDVVYGRVTTSGLLQEAVVQRDCLMTSRFLSVLTFFLFFSVFTGFAGHLYTHSHTVCTGTLRCKELCVTAKR